MFSLLQEEVVTHADVEISSLFFCCELFPRAARTVQGSALRFEIASGLRSNVGVDFTPFAFDLKAIAIHMCKCNSDGLHLRLNT